MFVILFVIMATFMGIVFREEIKEIYKEWHDEKYGIDFHDIR